MTLSKPSNAARFERELQVAATEANAIPWLALVNMRLISTDCL